MGSDNTDRVLDDLKANIEKLPPRAIGIVLSSWSERICTLAHRLELQGKPSDDPDCPIATEMRILKRNKVQIRAACAAMRKDPDECLKILVEDLEFD